MRAAVHERYGPPSVVAVKEAEKPVADDNDILIRVRAATVNRTDCGYRGASPFPIRFITGLRKPRYTIWGTEYAGEVEEVGSSVTNFKVGDRVFGYNEGPFGTHAEYLVVGSGDSVAKIPDGVSFEHAAASTEGCHYAILNLRMAKAGDGNDVLVYGATGAIGSAAVQLAKERGATVTAVCGTDHVDLVAGLGPDRVVDYQTTDFTDDQKRYDFVFDAVGKVTYSQCKGLLKPGGIFASTELGPWVQNLLLTIGTRFIGSNRVIFAFPRHNQRMIERFAGMLEEASLVPLLDRTYPLDEIADAYTYAESGQKLGNVIIAI